MHVRKRPNSFISFAATNRSILALELGISMAGLTERPSENKTAVSLLGLAWKLGKCLLIGLTYDMCTVNTSRDRGLLLMYKLKKIFRNDGPRKGQEMASKRVSRRNGLAFSRKWMRLCKVPMRRLSLEQGRILGKRVMDGWTGAVLQKLLTVQECDEQTS